MSDPFFEKPILNSPYARPARHWELDAEGQPTQKIIENRRRAEFITPIPKPKKRKTPPQQDEIVFDEGKGLSTKEQQYDATSSINQLCACVEAWRALPHSNLWQVTPETARLRTHWRRHNFTGVRPFFCQIEAVETAIWLTEVAPKSKSGKLILDHLAAANRDANPELTRLALKLATGAGKDHRHGHAHRLADHQRGAAVRQQAFHPRFSRLRPRPDHQRPPARSPAQ
jgi:type III restriction enzyme